MTPLFKKLNFKNQQEIGVFNFPDSFAIELHAMKEQTNVVHDVTKIKEGTFLMAFAIKQQEVDYWSKQLSKYLSEDGVLWFCYPKGTSKKYTCEFNRDTGWHELAKLGFEPVRAVAVDADWSAMRFRKPEHIKKMTRSSAISEEGKKRITKK